MDTLTQTPLPESQITSSKKLQDVLKGYFNGCILTNREPIEEIRFLLDLYIGERLHLFFTLEDQKTLQKYIIEAMNKYCNSDTPFYISLNILTAVFIGFMDLHDLPEKHSRVLVGQLFRDFLNQYPL